MEEKNNNNYNLIIKVSTITKVMVFGGVLLFVIAKIALNYLSSYTIWKIAFNIFESLGITCFSAGLVSVIVEISTIKSLVSRAFKDILSGKFDLSVLDKKALVTLKQDIAHKIIKSDNENFNKDLINTPYRYEDKLLNCVNEKYYEHHNLTYHITPDEINKCFHLKLKVDFRIINKSQIDNNFELRLKLYKTQKMNGIKIEDYFDNNFKLNVEINNVPIDIKDIVFIEPVVHNTESTYYDYKIRIQKALEKTENKIFAEINYDIPIHDITQSFKISAPCKNIQHKFFINNDLQTGAEWVIHATAYSTFYHRQDEEGSNYKVDQNVDNSLIINYKDWALVGNGYCVYYQKKY